MSSAAAGSETGPGPSPGTDHELHMQQPPPLQQQEVVLAVAELQAPAPVRWSWPRPRCRRLSRWVTIRDLAAGGGGARAQGRRPGLPGPSGGRGRHRHGRLGGRKGAELARSDSFDEQCRVCQQKSEEPLVDLGCRCRGDLSKAHRTCIDVWFRTRGSNKCEICQQVAVNIPPPETQASTSYWVWRVDSAYGRGRAGRERGWFSPLWVAFAILIGGLLLDVLISVSLGVSTLPVNIIIGVLIVLGLGTALRLALECCQEFGSRRSMPRMENMAPSGYHPGV
ncbi:hypothetical protein ACQ4PT_016320 [Festuca glaucescens]